MLVFLLVAWALFRPATPADASSTEIPMTLYTDNSCNDASTTAANVSLNLDVCTVTPGLGSFVLNSFPCSSGSVIGYVFSDTACGNANQNNLFKGGGGDGVNPHCYGPIKGDLAAVMLSCDQNAPGKPSSTTTIKVGPIATGASKTSPTSPSSTSNGASSDGSSSSSSNDSGTPRSSSSGWNSLNSGTRIGIIVALSVGIPLLTICGIYEERKRKAQNSSTIAMPPYTMQRLVLTANYQSERYLG